MSALGVSLSMRCRRGGQLAAVAEPPSGFGRILIIAAASSSPGAGAAIVTIPVGRSPSPPSPTAKAPRWAACRTPSRHQAGASLGTALVGAVLIASLTTGLVNGVQDSSAILANVTTHATTQLEAGVPVHLRQRRPPAALRTLLWVVALIAVVALFFIGLIPTEPVGRAKPNWPLLIPHRRLPAAPPVPLSSMPGQPTQAY